MRLTVLAAYLCTSVIARADCPTPQWPLAWYNGTNNSYSFNLGAGGGPPNPLMPIPWDGLSSTIQDVNQAIGLWTNANQVNGTAVSFYFYGIFNDNNPGGVLDFHAYSVNYPGGVGDPGVASQIQAFRFVGTNLIASAHITLYYGSINPVIGLVVDPSSPDYDAAEVRWMLHELGHSMGLENQFEHSGYCLGQTAGESVMNATCGTNDSAHNIASNITACDQQSVW